MNKPDSHDDSQMEFHHGMDHKKEPFTFYEDTLAAFPFLREVNAQIPVGDDVIRLVNNVYYYGRDYPELIDQAAEGNPSNDIESFLEEASRNLADIQVSPYANALQAFTTAMTIKIEQMKQQFKLKVGNKKRDMRDAVYR